VGVSGYVREVWGVCHGMLSVRVNFDFRLCNGHHPGIAVVKNGCGIASGVLISLNHHV
jgi:hypothetical protein